MYINKLDKYINKFNSYNLIGGFLKVDHDTINKLFENLDGHNVNRDGYDPKYPLTYGEITLDGIENIGIKLNKLQNINTYPSNQKVCYDLGSGIGKFVIMIAHIFPNIISRGIELVCDRHDQAIKAYDRITDISIKNRIKLECGSLFDIKLNDAAWIFISNLCFSESLNLELSNKITNETNKNTLIICSKKIHLSSDLFTLTTTTIEMTWAKESNVYLYQRIN